MEEERQSLKTEERKRSEVNSLDHGWAWVVALAGTIVMFLGLGVYRSLAILSVEVADVYDASAAETSMIFSCVGIGLCFSAVLFISGVGDIFHERALVVISGSLISLGFVVTYFSTKIQQVYFLGFCTGSAMQVGQGCVSTMAGKYFRKRLSRAMGLIMSGTSLAILVLPPFIQWLFDEYTYRGASLVLAGIALNTWAAGALMRPVNSTPGLRQSEVLAEKLQMDTFHKQEHGTDINVSDSSKSDTPKNPPTKESCEVDSLVQQNTIQNNLPEDRRHRGKPSLCRRVGKSIQSFSFQETKHRPMMRSPVKSLAFSFKFFKSPTFVLFQVFIYFTSVGCECLIQFYPALTRELGLTAYQSAFLMSIVGGADLVGRIFYGILGDCNFMERYKLVIIPQIILGVASLLAHLFTTFWSQVIFAVVIGFNYGISFSFRSVLLMDLFDMPSLLRRIGVTNFVTGIAFATGTPAIGSIRDITGNFRRHLQLVGLCFVCSSASLVAIGVRRWYQRRKQKRIQRASC